MIKNILDLLKLDDYYGVSEYIDIAKGKYQAPKTLKQTYNKRRRWHKQETYK
jgi:hypothetical protein